VDCTFSGEVWHWRGPAPYHFVTLPEEQAGAIESVARLVTYGWGMVPVQVRIGATTWRTSLFPKDGGYVLPLRDSVRRRERVELGETVDVHLTVGRPAT
jgi:Domain of unknown function (DUF1905)